MFALSSKTITSTPIFAVSSTKFKSTSTLKFGQCITENTQHIKATIRSSGLPPSSGIFIISHHILKPICNHSFNILFKYHTNTDIILALIPYDNHFSITVKSLFTICDVSDICCRQPTPHKTITYWFSIIFFDILPTCYRHLSPTFTSVLPPHYRHYYRQKEIYTDIYTDKTVSTFSVHRPTAKLITFPKLFQKRESGD